MGSYWTVQAGKVLQSVQVRGREIESGWAPTGVCKAGTVWLLRWLGGVRDRGDQQIRSVRVTSRWCEA